MQACLATTRGARDKVIVQRCDGCRFQESRDERKANKKGKPTRKSIIVTCAI